MQRYTMSTGNSNQQWQLVSLGGGYYNIENRTSSKVLDLTGGDTDDGTTIQQWTSTGSDTNQAWEFVPANREANRGLHLDTAVQATRVEPVKELLLAWYRANGRDLPWRRTRDPYAILVSEIMLQQTQVERVIPRWQAWLERWPTVPALAAASAGDVILAWQGLGYNRRALNLHRAAQHVAAHGWPDDLTELPGVGPYTAAAVGNFAFGRDVLPVDVNIGRVQERTGERFDAECAQALFDLGATVCLARIPRCGACPLASACPSRGKRYEPLRKQSRFEGSFRQRRAVALRAVAAGEQPDDGDALVSLARDGLVVLEDGVASLPA